MDAERIINALALIADPETLAAAHADLDRREAVLLEMPAMAEKRKADLREREADLAKREADLADSERLLADEREAYKREHRREHEAMLDLEIAAQVQMRAVEMAQAELVGRIAARDAAAASG
jgi:hypothetical protein